MHAGILVSIVILVVIVVLMAVSMWRLFEKAGRAGWKCLIPIYNVVVLCRIGNVPTLLLIFYLLVYLLAATLQICGTMLSIPMIFISFALSYYIYGGVCEQFNKRDWFAIGTWFFPFIFFPILAFGSSEYQNPEEA